MTTPSFQDALPPVRKAMFRHSMRIVALYAAMGTLMLIAVFIASGPTLNAVHRNYDSIAATSRMKDAWDALANPALHSRRTPAEWTAQFDQALAFEESNITEPGEGETTRTVREIWDRRRARNASPDAAEFTAMESALDRLIDLNEKGLFASAEASQQLRQRILIAELLLFPITLAIALYLAEGLSDRIANPLRELSASLMRKPDPGAPLRLPKPTTLEMRILTHELSALWQRVSELRKLNLEELTTRRQQLETVLTSVDDAILVVDNAETVTHCNGGMLALLGIDAEELIGRRWRDLSSNSANYLRLRELLTGAITSEQTVELQTSSGPRTFAGRRRAISDPRGQEVGSLYLLHDITDIKQKDRLRAEFIGVLSHELKTPLQSLGTASELLLARKALLDEDGRLLVETIHEDVGRIKGVANEFVQVGLVNLHSLRLKIEPRPISALVPQWIQPFQVLARDRAVTIVYKQEGSETISSRIDPVKFPWAVTNLVSNAIRVSPPGSVVEVRLTDREGRADIEVRDEGPGIPAEMRERMFDPYYQGQGAGSGERPSGFLGLGLTITKEVVEAHGGEIEYFPRQPRGSTFRIRLPLLI